LPIGLRTGGLVVLPSRWTLDMKKLVVSAALSLVILGCKKEGGYVEPPPPDVTVAKPLVRTVTNYLVETGTTEAVERVEIRARVRGYLVEQMFEAGADVKEGEPLYRIEPAEYQAKVDAATAELESAKVALEKGEIEYARQKKLRQSNATSEANVVAARAERDSSVAAVAERTAQLEQAKLDLGYTEIKSPIDGRVGKTLVKPGNLVGDNEATHLTTVVSYDPIYANFNLSERDLLRIMEQSPNRRRRAQDGEQRPLYLQRAIDDGFPFTGEFDYADLAVDQSTGTFLVRGKFPNTDQGILPGLFVTIKIPLGKNEDAILIPEVAISSDQAGRYVWTVGEDNVVKRANVKVGAKYGELIVIREGVKPDDWVIIEGIQQVRINAKVNRQETEVPDTADQDPGPAEEDQTAPAPAAAGDATPATNRGPDVQRAEQANPENGDVDDESKAEEGKAAK
jgi:RND family efflux transporter MFP subunit